MNNKRKSPDRRKWNLVEEKSFPYNRPNIQTGD